MHSMLMLHLSRAAGKRFLASGSCMDVNFKTKFHTSHPCDTSVCNDGAVLEEDQGVQLNRGPPRHLSIAMPSVEVVCECVHSSPVPCRFRQWCQA